MTHDELLARLQHIRLMEGDDKFHLNNALRAVVELHAAQFETFDDNEGGTIEGYWCKSCDDTEYPCPTIQTIEKELKWHTNTIL